MKVTIDANIARSSGNTEEHPASKLSRDLLIKIKDDSSIDVLLCDKLYDEWQRHMSRFARTWYSSMISRRRIKRIVIDTHDFDRRIDEIDMLSNKQKEDAKKDSHLIILAQSDKVIFSIEINSRQIYADHKDSLPEVCGIAWRSPVKEWDDCIDLLLPSCNIYRYIF